MSTQTLELVEFDAMDIMEVSSIVELLEDAPGGPIQHPTACCCTCV